jgi:hypothetical protein
VALPSGVGGGPGSLVVVAGGKAKVTVGSNAGSVASVVAVAACRTAVAGGLAVFVGTAGVIVEPASGVTAGGLLVRSSRKLQLTRSAAMMPGRSSRCTQFFIDPLPIVTVSCHYHSINGNSYSTTGLYDWSTFNLRSGFYPDLASEG